jgi:dTDP-4-amino-4,6-dideoxygalactose transaminase
MSLVPFIDLAWQWEEIEKESIPQLMSLLRSGKYVSGTHVTRFEGEFATKCKSRFAVGVNSGTSALHAGMSRYNFLDKDEIIVPSHTFIASVTSILLSGATPVLVDVNRNGLMDFSAFMSAVTPNTRGILAVHLYGSCVEESIFYEAKRLGLKVFEDSSQSHLATFESGLPVGHYGEFSAYSFYPGKNLGGVGEGGILTTNDPELYEYAKRFRNWGTSVRYFHEEFGLNYRMDEIQALVLRKKLEKLDAWTEERQKIANIYTEAVHANDKIELVNSLAGKPVFHQYVIKASNRDFAMKYFQNKEIETSVHYPVPVHRQRALEGRFIQGSSLQITEDLVRGILSMPIFPGMQNWQIEKVAEAIAKCP